MPGGVANQETSHMLDQFQSASPWNPVFPTMPLCVLVTLCWWWEGLVLRQGGPLGIEQEIVEELYFLSDSSHLFSVFV